MTEEFVITLTSEIEEVRIANLIYLTSRLHSLFLNLKENKTRRRIRSSLLLELIVLNLIHLEIILCECRRELNDEEILTTYFSL